MYAIVAEAHHEEGTFPRIPALLQTAHISHRGSPLVVT